MCGIAAVLFHATRDQKWAEAGVEKMLQRTAHRGYHYLNQHSCGGHAILGCVRLPIRDPLAGVQPAFNADRTVMAVLNGEIYNATNLIAPAPLASNSDTAILPYLYRSSSSEPPQLERLLQCRGMFAIVLYDADSAQVLCLRDHVGIKPLFAGEGPGGFFIASEGKAFLDQDLEWSREVPPGCLLTFTFKDGQWTVAPDEDITSRLRKDCTPSSNVVPKVLRETIGRVIERQWPVENMPVAVLCSGGIDSSIVTYELNKLASSEQPLVAYTASCTGTNGTSAGSDVVAARRLCTALGVPLREVRVSHDDILNELGTVIYHTETFEPNVVRNAAIQFCLMREIAADGFRVAFCGEGADELFWGYADFASATDPEALAKSLLSDLHRTQLLRVDRVGMAHTVEVRVPFLDEEIVNLALSISGDDKSLDTCGIWLGKRILRTAYADVLPDEIVLRRKATLAFGAGFGGVEMDDQALNERSLKLLAQRRETIDGLERKFPVAFRGKKTAERALYVSVFDKLGFDIPSNYSAPIVALRERN